MKNPQLRWPHVTARVLAGTLGAYACSWGFAAASVATLVALDVAYHDAEIGALITAVLAFLGLMLWSFSVASVVRCWVALVGGAVVMFSLAWAVQRAILS